MVARLLPVTSFVGDRQPRVISFFSVAVTRPPLRSGRDTPPWFAPSPSKPLTRIPGRLTVPPFGRDRQVGRSENQDQKIKQAIIKKLF